MKNPSCTSFLPFLCVSVSLWFPSPAVSADWAHWRGPEQNGVSREKDLPERFSLDPKAEKNNLIWRAPYGGRSTPLIMNGRVFLINKVGGGLSPEQRLTQQERVMCLDANTGKMLWEQKFNLFFTDIQPVRLGWTNLAGDPETGNIYAHGTQGLLLCFNRDGKVLWSHSLTEEYGRISGYGGRLPSPVVDEDKVIIGMVNASWGEYATGGNRYMAFDKKTGVPIWLSSSVGRPVDTHSSSPVIAVVNGERLLISGGADGSVHALTARTGEKVWSYIFGTGAVNALPVVDGNRIYIGHGDENPDNNHQGRVICLDAAKVKDGKPALVWQVDEIKAKFASPVLHDGRLYVCDEGATMYCLDAAKGEQLWKYSYGRDCKGSPVWADGKLYVAEVNAKFHILKPSDKDCARLYAQIFRSPDGQTAVEIAGSPAVANGRIYFCTSFETFCIGKKDHKTPADTMPLSVKEPPPATGAKPAHVQVVPADVALEPGESAQFQVRVYDEHGRLLKETKAEKWALAATPTPEGLPPAPPPAKDTPPAPTPPVLQGEVTADGKLTVSKTVPGQYGLVLASVGGLTGKARVRVTPSVTYRQDFEKVPLDRTPAGWVNCQGKFAVQKKGDSNVLVKLANNASPLLAKANAYIGKPTLTDYTIQANVMGTQKGTDLPDMGVVANRYTFLLSGSTQTLRLVSWDALPRVDKSTAWPWKPSVWYTLKFTVDVSGNKAQVRGKIWQRDQAEPRDWTLVFEDPLPNREGAPALYGNATGIIGNQPGTEIYYDNVAVTPNKK